MANNDDHIAINKRFFEAIDVLIQQNKIRGLGTFTRMNNLNYGNTHTIRKDPYRKVFKVELLTYICRDFNVSPEWLILGTGPMFKDDNNK